MAYNVVGLVDTQGGITEYGSTSGGGGGSITSEIWYSITLASSGWTLDSTTNTYIYSLESTYPSATYDILNVLPDSNTTSVMRQAWVAADCGGHESTNIIRCHGTTPSINITLGICIRSNDGSTPPSPPIVS